MPLQFAFGLPQEEILFNYNVTVNNQKYIQMLMNVNIVLVMNVLSIAPIYLEITRAIVDLDLLENHETRASVSSIILLILINVIILLLQCITVEYANKNNT